MRQARLAGRRSRPSTADRAASVSEAQVRPNRNQRPERAGKRVSKEGTPIVLTPESRSSGRVVVEELER
jgi:hypothetical protein